MNGTAKNLKIFSLASLFCGLAVTVAGVVLALGGSNLDWWPAAAGAALLVFGVRASILANVPSNAPKLTTLAAVVALIELLITGGLAYLAAGGGAELAPTSPVLAAVCALMALVTCLQARRLKKELERA